MCKENGRASRGISENVKGPLNSRFDGQLAALVSRSGVLWYTTDEGSRAGELAHDAFGQIAFGQRAFGQSKGTR